MDTLDARPGRMLVRTGLQHAARGDNFLGYRDVGGWVAEAVTEDARTLHVAVVPVEGALNAWMPGRPVSALAQPFDGAAAAGRYFDLAPFVDASDPSAGRVVVDLRVLRDVARRSGIGPLVERFDFLVLVRRASPASFLVDPTAGARRP